MLTARTDLAMESHRLWQESAGKTTQLRGVRAEERVVEGFPLHRVDILDNEGERALGKPRGTYLTLDISTFWDKNVDNFFHTVSVFAAQLAPMLPKEGTIFMAGLGNLSMTPDALGPLTVDSLLITRHLGEILPTLRPVSAVAAGVLGTTGVEAAEWVRGISRHVRPAAVILVDALAARELGRVCTSIQLSDTGIIPGSGVGNHRMALNQDTLGVPVISVGIPTVVDAATIARDILAEAGAQEGEPDCLQGRGGQFFLTPDSIDRKIRQLAKLLGYGISMAAQPGLSCEDLTALLE